MLHQSVIDMEGYRYVTTNQNITIEGISEADNGLRADKILIS